MKAKGSLNCQLMSVLGKYECPGQPSINRLLIELMLKIVVFCFLSSISATSILSTPIAAKD